MSGSITLATVASYAAIAGGVAAVGSAAYSLAQGQPKVPSVPATPPAATPPSLASAAVGPAGGGNRASQNSKGQGFGNTISTSPLGTGGPPSSAKAALGAGVGNVDNPLGGSSKSSLLGGG